MFTQNLRNLAVKKGNRNGMVPKGGWLFKMDGVTHCLFGWRKGISWHYLIVVDGKHLAVPLGCGHQREKGQSELQGLRRKESFSGYRPHSQLMKKADVVRSWEAGSNFPSQSFCLSGTRVRRSSEQPIEKQRHQGLRNGEGVNGSSDTQGARRLRDHGDCLAEGPFPLNLPGVMNFLQHSDWKQTGRSSPLLCFVLFG